MKQAGLGYHFVSRLLGLVPTLLMLITIAFLPDPGGAGWSV